MGDAPIVKRGHDLLADGAGSENKGGALGQLAENALGEFHAGGRDRHRAGAEFGLRADALADFQGALEKAIEDRASGALFVRETVSLADLAEDFGFTEQHGIESGGDLEEVAHGFAIIVMIKRAVQDIGANGVKLAEKRRETGGAFVGGFRRDTVDFTAIASRQDERFLQDATGAQLIG